MNRIDRYSGRDLADDVEEEGGLSVSERVGKFQTAKAELARLGRSAGSGNEALIGTRRERREAEKALTESIDHAVASITRAELSKAAAAKEISRELYQDILTHREKLKEKERRREHKKDQERDPLDD